MASFGMSTHHFEVAYITDEGKTGAYLANNPVIRNMVEHYQQLHSLIKRKILKTPVSWSYELIFKP